MDDKERKFEHESVQNAAALAKYLHHIAEGLAGGGLSFASDGEELRMNPNGMIKFEMEAKRKGSSGKLKIKLSWKEGQSLTACGEALRIGKN